MVAVVLFEATDLAWPLHERRGWLRLAGTTGLLTLAQQAIAFAATAVPAARRVPFDLAQGGLIGLLAGLFLAQPAGLPLPWALLTTLVVAVAAVATLLVLGARAVQPVWVGLGGLVLFLAVTPDLGGQLAPLALRGLAQAPLGGWLPAQVPLWLGALAVIAWLAPRGVWPAGLLAALVLWGLGALTAGAGGGGAWAALVWTAQGALPAGLAGRDEAGRPDVLAGALWALTVGCWLQWFAYAGGSERGGAVLVALGLWLVAYRSTGAPSSIER